MKTSRKWHQYLMEAECIFSIAAVTAVLLWIIAATSHEFVGGKVLSVMVIAMAIVTTGAVYSYLKD